ncbi:MAG TPA: DNA topoisomerase IB [Acidobacteriaceae bacterium]|nr:DNA topoisomerase IB [Acidobacteriaceae bacterium]
MRPEDKVPDPTQSARDAGLRYVSDRQPGIQRKRQGKGFRYIGVDGSLVRDPDVLGRIKSLVIPPAWKQVWICPDPKGHLQATGRDAKGRKQSKYHPRWREVRDETKYERMVLFGASLPAIREQVERDLALAGVPRRKVLATIVRLMETTYIRVGNAEYARENHSYGLTTMRGRHVQVDGSKITFKFQGKSGVRHTVDVQDRRLAKIVRQCQDLPGYELFQYVGDDGETHSIDSADVNDYLREISGREFTAKDFRTWAGTLLACVALQECNAFESESQAKKNVVRAIQSVSEQLGNTPSVCRKCYVHPVVLENYMSGMMKNIPKPSTQRRRALAAHALRQEESALIRLLKRKPSK